MKEWSWSRALYCLFFYSLASCSFWKALELGKSNWQIMAVLVAFSTACLFFANLSTFETFILGPSGLEIKRFKEKAEKDLQNMQREMAETLSDLALYQVKMAGRLGGLPREQQLEIQSRLKKLLENVESNPSTINEIFEKNCYPIDEFDYGMAALGGNQIPKDLPKEHLKEWEELRKGGIKNRPTPEQIEAFWKKFDLLTTDRQEKIEDYKYYLSHRTHKRLEHWLNERG